MQRKYETRAAKRKLRVEQEKQDQQLKKKMPRLLIYGFETSSISNIKRKKPLLNEGKNECIKTNEVKMTLKSRYQISAATIEVDVNVNVSQPPAMWKDMPKAMVEAESKACTSQKTNPLFTKRRW